MPSLNDLPGEIKRNKLVRALQRVGFDVDYKGGNGSHCKVTWHNGKCIIIPSKIHKRTLYYILEEIESYTGITWATINGEL